MWNLGRGRSGPRTPGGQGFDTVVFPETIGFGKDAYFDDKGNYLSDRLADETLAFIERNRGRPFFVYLADPGKSRQTPPSRVNRIRRTTPKPTAPVTHGLLGFSGMSYMLKLLGASGVWSCLCSNTQQSC